MSPARTTRGPRNTGAEQQHQSLNPKEKALQEYRYIFSFASEDDFTFTEESCGKYAEDFTKYVKNKLRDMRNKHELNVFEALVVQLRSRLEEKLSSLSSKKRKVFQSALRPVLAVVFGFELAREINGNEENAQKWDDFFLHKINNDLDSSGKVTSETERIEYELLIRDIIMKNSIIRRFLDFNAS